MKPQEMWAVVAPEWYGSGPVMSVERTKRSAKNTALSFYEPSSKWAYAKEYLGWRCIRVVVTPVEQEKRFSVKAAERGK